MMKNSFLVMIALILFSLSSCERFDLDKRDFDKDHDGYECFEFIYPISFEMPDESIIILENEDDKEAIREWYEDHEDVAKKPSLIFPIEIAYDDKDEIVSIENEEELRKAKKDCYRDWEKEDCFELMYPISYEMPDGSIIELEKKEDWDSIKVWYEDHEDVDARPSLVYPVDIIYNEEDEEEKILTIENEEELIKAKKACERSWKKDQCFEIVFPVSFEMPDGSIIELEEKEDWGLIKDWYEDHEDVKMRPSFVFPIEIIYEKGDDEEEVVVSIENEEELFEAKKDCYRDWEKDECFELVYPVSFEMPDGSIISLESKEDWLTIKEWYEDHEDVDARPSLIYPVDIIFEAGDEAEEIVTIEDEEEMEAAKDDCE